MSEVRVTGNLDMLMMTPVPVRRLACGLAVLAILLVGGCSTTRHETPEETQTRLAAERAKSAEAVRSSMLGKQHQLSIPELDQLTYGYADRYYTVMSDAVDEIKRSNPDPIQRRMAHQIKLNGCLSMNDIVSGNDPYSQVFDLVVSVTLQSIVLIDENGAEKAFGDRAPALIKAIRTARVEAWELADKVLTQEQLEQLDYLILEWRRAHPEVEQVAFIKFDNFAGTRSAGMLAELKSGGGLLAPLSTASQVLKDWGRLTERVFWYSKRAPNIAAIQAEGAVNEILATPEVNSMLLTAQQLGKTADAIPQTMVAERKALFAELDARQTLLTNTLGDVRHIVADADSLGLTISLLATNIQQTLATFGDTLKVADTVGQHFHFGQPKPASAHPFDIAEYTTAIVRLNEAITNLHELSLSADQLTRSEGWRNGLHDISEITDRRVDRAFSRICMALGLAFLLAIVYRVIAIQLSRRMAPSVREKQ
jgi:hypothetical protein